MGEIFKWLFDKAADIIRAVQNPWGLAALIVLVLGIVGAYFFRIATEKLKLAAFAMIIAGLLGLFIFARSSGDSNNNTDRIPEAETCAHYAASALADYKRMMEIPKCQDYTTTLFFIRWQSTYQGHLTWCKSVPSSWANWESEMRDAHLKQCGAR
jgi:hypothetical protein